MRARLLLLLGVVLAAGGLTGCDWRGVAHERAVASAAERSAAPSPARPGLDVVQTAPELLGCRGPVARCAAAVADLEHVALLVPPTLRSDVQAALPPDGRLITYGWREGASAFEVRVGAPLAQRSCGRGERAVRVRGTAGTLSQGSGTGTAGTLSWREAGRRWSVDVPAGKPVEETLRAVEQWAPLPPTPSAYPCWSGCAVTDLARATRRPLLAPAGGGTGTVMAVRWSFLDVPLPRGRVATETVALPQGPVGPYEGVEAGAPSGPARAVTVAGLPGQERCTGRRCDTTVALPGSLATAALAWPLDSTAAERDAAGAGLVLVRP